MYKAMLKKEYAVIMTVSFFSFKIIIELQNRKTSPIYAHGRMDRRFELLIQACSSFFCTTSIFGIQRLTLLNNSTTVCNAEHRKSRKTTPERCASHELLALLTVIFLFGPVKTL